MRTRTAAVAAVLATLSALFPLGTEAAHADTGPIEIATAVGSDFVSRAKTVQLNTTPNVKYVSFNYVPAGTDGFYVSLNHPAGDVAPGTYSFTSDDPLHLSASAGSAGCFGFATGTLVVHEARFAADGTPIAVALDYTLDCSATNYGNLAGVVRWHSDVPFSAGTTAPVNAGQQIVGTTSSHDVTINNVGSRALSLGPATLEGPDAGRWSIRATTCGTTLDVGASCAATVTAAPTSGGPYRWAGLTMPADVPGNVLRAMLHMSPVDVPSQPAEVTVSTGIGRAQIRWSAAQSADVVLTRYTITRAEPGGARTVIGTVAPYSYTRYDDDTVVPGHTYIYGVAGENVAGRGPTQLATAATIPQQELVMGLRRFGAPGQAGIQDWPDGGYEPNRRVVGETRDGRYEILTGQVNGTDGLWAQENDGNDPRRLGTGAVVAAPSPDSSRLLVLRRADTAPYASTLTILPIAGGPEQRIPAPADVSSADWLDNRTAVLVLKADHRLVRVDVASGAVSTIPGGAGALDAIVSPDGRRIAFTHADSEANGAVTATSVQLLPATGGTPQALPGSWTDASVTEWTSDSRTVLAWAHVVVDPYNQTDRLFAVPLDGTTPTAWTDAPFHDVRMAVRLRRSPAPHAVPRLAVSPYVVKFGQTAYVTITGTPGATVDLYSRKYLGSFVKIRDGLVLDAAGRATVATKPDQNLRFQAQDRALTQGSSLAGSSGLMTVQKNVSLNVRRDGTRRFTFYGSISPLHPGATVSLYRNGSLLRSGIPVNSSRVYSWTTTLPAGTYSFQARTGASGYNAASVSLTRTTRIS